MKRIAVLLFVITLLLSACTQPAAPETTPSTVPAEPSAQPTSEAGTEASSAETVPTEPAPAESPAYSAAGTRTAGGVLVRTDPSAYRPYQAPEAKYSRLREGPLERFEPSADYGAVYPYQAARLFYGTEEGASWEIGGLYGFMDRTGRILTDGLYSSVDPLILYDDDGAVSVRLPCWVVSRVLGLRQPDGDPWEESRFSADDTRYGVVSMDGSFALDCDYLSVQALENGFVCVESWSPCSFTIYDLAGRPVLTEAELFGDEKPVIWRVDYGEGLYLTMSCDEDYRYEYRFRDPDGTERLGPYSSAKPFCEGLANVSPDGSGNGFIDKNGDWVIQPNYRRYTSFRDGSVLLSDLDYNEVVLDRTGRELLHVAPGENLYDESHAFVRLRQDGQGQSVSEIYDRQGRLLRSCPGFPIFADDTVYWYGDDEGRTHVCSLREDDKELVVDAVTVITPGVTLRNGALCAGYIGFSDSSGKQIFITGDLSDWERQSGLPSPSAESARNFNAVTDEFTGEDWYFCWSGTAWEGLNKAAWLQLCGREAGDAGSPERLTVPLQTAGLKLRGDRICGETEDAFCCLDRDGRLVFRWPLDAGD